MYTKGSLLSGRLDAQRPEPYRPVDVDGHEYMGECHAHGIRRRITPDIIDAWGEAEYEARTAGNFADRPTCATCNERISLQGGCACGYATAADRMRAAIFGQSVAVAEDNAPGIIGVPVESPRTDRPSTAWDENYNPVGVMPSSAHLPDLPEDATPEQVAEWRAGFERMKALRESYTANTFPEYRSLLERD